MADALHDAFRKASLQKLHQGIDPARAIATDRLPLQLRHRPNADRDGIDRRAADPSFYFEWPDLQINHRTVAHIGAAARQTAFVIAITSIKNRKPVIRNRLPRWDR